jgi:hypothetical protein
MRTRNWVRSGLLLAGVLAPSGCAELLGLLDRPVDEDTGGTGATGASTGSTSGGGGTGTTGACTPEATEKCDYAGPPGTKDVGSCQAAERTCNAVGTAWGPCVGEVTPVLEDCTTPVDDDCDGDVNEAEAGCACVPGEMDACYEGAPGTLGIGKCAAGTRTCEQSGLGFGSCVGQTLPGVEAPKVIGDEDCDGFASSEATLASIFGDSGQQRGLAVAVDPSSGEIYVAGEFTGALTFGSDVLVSDGVADAGDIFVAKLAANGTPIWAKQFGDAAGDQGVNGLAVDGSGAVVLTGYNRYGAVDFGGGALPSGIFVAKLNADGGHDWSRSCGNDLGAGVAVATTAEGDAVVTGSFGGTMDCGTGPVAPSAFDDIFLMKLSGASGEVSWLDTFAGSSMDTPAGVAVDAFGNIFLAGTFFGTIDLQGNTFANGDGSESFITKRTNDGEHLWSRGIGGAGNQVTSGLTATPLGGVVVVGNFESTVTLEAGSTLTSAGQVDAFAIGYGASGDLSWKRSVGGADDQGATCVAVDAKGRVSLGGTFKSGIDIGLGVHAAGSPADGFVAQLSSAGETVWDRVFGGTTHGVQMAAQPDGRIVIIGTADGSLDFGLGPLPTKAFDLFVARLDP